MQRILVIDDDLEVTGLLKRGFSYAGFCVETAETGERGLALARQSPPDLVILDIMMPQLDGFEVLQRLRNADIHLPVLFLTAKDAPGDEISGLEAGADDYVSKPFKFEVLVARVRCLLRRQHTEHPLALHFLDLTLDTETHMVQRGLHPIGLTGLEFKLLHEFMLHPQQVISKEALLDRVWGYDFGGNTNVVEVYVKQLRQKLRTNENDVQFIHTIRSVGYTLREE